MGGVGGRTTWENLLNTCRRTSLWTSSRESTTVRWHRTCGSTPPVTLSFASHRTVATCRSVVEKKNPFASAVVWEDTQRRIYAVIAKVFRAAAIAHPEIQSSQCRAIYGVDVMLDDQMRPKLLEVGGGVRVAAGGSREGCGIASESTLLAINSDVELDTFSLLPFEAREWTPAQMNISLRRVLILGSVGVYGFGVLRPGHILPRLHTGSQVRHEGSDGAQEGQVVEGGGVLQHRLSVPVSERDSCGGRLGVKLDDVSGAGGVSRR